VPPAAATARSNTRYKVQRGDTLVTVADRFDVTPEQLRRWNHLRNGKVARGQILYVAEPAHITTRTKGRHAVAGNAHVVSARLNRGNHAAHSVRKSAGKNAVKGTARKGNSASSRKQLASAKKTQRGE
jgi:membrane-bound lytic murein transglycosylase D